MTDNWSPTSHSVDNLKFLTQSQFILYICTDINIPCYARKGRREKETLPQVYAAALGGKDLGPFSKITHENALIEMRPQRAPCGVCNKHRKKHNHQDKP